MKLISSTVIIAEDEVLIRMIAADALTSAGFLVIEVDDADAAITVLHSRATDICALFTDVNMPGAMDGLSLAHHTSANWPWVRLLVTSGNPQPKAVDLPDGCRFLPKPYETNHMVNHIQELAAHLEPGLRG